MSFKPKQISTTVDEDDFAYVFGTLGHDRYGLKKEVFATLLRQFVIYLKHQNISNNGPIATPDRLIRHLKCLRFGHAPELSTHIVV